MAIWIEYIDCYEVKVYRDCLINITEFEIDDGLAIVYGEHRNKRKRYKFLSIIFDKDQWTLEEAGEFWMDYEFRIIHKKQWGTKIPPADMWVETDRDVYVFVCQRQIPKKDWRSAKSEIEEEGNQDAIVTCGDLETL